MKTITLRLGQNYVLERKFKFSVTSLTYTGLLNSKLISISLLISAGHGITCITHYVNLNQETLLGIEKYKKITVTRILDDGAEVELSIDDN